MATSGRERLPIIAAAAGAVVAAAAWLVLAIGHLSDRYSVDQASGSSMALADLARRGTLYPELFDGVHYGGTRYMPLGTVLHGWLAALTDDLIVSGKLMSELSAIAVVALLVVTMRRLGTSWVVVLALVAVLLSTRPFMFTSFNARSDTLAAALQLGSLLLIWSRPGRGAATAGGVLAALAVFARFTAVWAAVAGAIWLWNRRRPDLPRFVLSAVLASVVVGGVAMVWSEGRMVENIIGLGAPGIVSTSAPSESIHRIYATGRYAGWASCLLLLGGGAAWLLGVVRRGTIRSTPFAMAAAVAAAIALVVFVDWGAWFNHFLDLEVLSVLTLAALAVDHQPALERRPLLTGVLAGGLAAIAAATTLVQHAAQVGDDTVDVAIDPFADVLEPDATLLSETPWYALVDGEQPVLLDPYMYRYVAEDHPDWDAALVGRIEDHEFDAVVLDFPLTDTNWYEHYFSPAVLGAIASSYEVTDHVGSHDVYTPRSPASAGTP